MTLLAAGAAQALPEDRGISLQTAGSPVAEEVAIFHNWVLMPVLTAICLFVLGLLAWVILRYNAKAHPEPRRFSHNTLVEVVWTVVPIMILLYIALFSFELLYKEDRIPDGKQIVAAVNAPTQSFVFPNDFNARRTVRNKAHLDVLKVADGETTRLGNREFKVDGYRSEILTINLDEPAQPGETVIIRGGRTRVGAQKILGLIGEDRSQIALAPTVTLKAIGRQWGWNYQYPELGEFEILSDLLPKDQIKNAEPYLYATNNDVVLPVGESIRLITNSLDVIHSWAMPAFALKMDAVPGRNNETWFMASRPGMYYGQCSEICGKDHAFMPISVKVVTRPEFEAWINEQRVMNGDEPMFVIDGAKVAQRDLGTATTVGTN